MGKRARLVYFCFPVQRKKRGKEGLKLGFLPLLEEPNTQVPVNKYKERENEKMR